VDSPGPCTSNLPVPGGCLQEPNGVPCVFSHSDLGLATDAWRIYNRQYLTCWRVLGAPLVGVDSGRNESLVESGKRHRGRFGECAWFESSPME
jgi:hypothetical protein